MKTMLRALLTTTLLTGCPMDQTETAPIGHPPQLNNPIAYSGRNDVGDVIHIMTPPNHLQLWIEIQHAKIWMRQANELLIANGIDTTPVE
jgi:hypothetical protein